MLSRVNKFNHTNKYPLRKILTMLYSQFHFQNTISFATRTKHYNNSNKNCYNSSCNNNNNNNNNINNNSSSSNNKKLIFRTTMKMKKTPTLITKEINSK